MGYQAHCIVMEEISKASGQEVVPASFCEDAQTSRQHWAFVRGTFPALHQSIVSERQ